MRRIYITLLVFTSAVLVGCKGNTYSKQLDDEKKLIAAYIAREGIHIINEQPDSEAGWGDKNYFAIPGYDNLYIHMVSPGDTNSVAAVAGDRILIRYKKYGLTTYSDTVNYWNTDDNGTPVQFQYLNLADAAACRGWHVAVGIMKYSGSQCQLICPSKMGFTSDNGSVTPRCYDMKIQIIRY